MAQIEIASANNSQISVSELSDALKRTLEDRFSYVRVRGEISGYRGPHTSGHAYFCLKDEAARLDAVIWRTQFTRLKMKPQEGLEVIAAGKISTFAGKSSYQLVIESLEPAGVGALMALLEKRRRQLAEEGLFDPRRKRSLPFLPRVVGVITSASGSVIHDIVHRLSDRFPTPVLLWPVRVQGDGAAEEIAAAIRGFNALTPTPPWSRPDVLIVARGGGSLEDLWAFNEEIVVRAAAESEIPLISAVGHETDWTLIDHVADVRAPTPTAAAEFCVPVRLDLLSNLSQLKRRGESAATRISFQGRADLRATARSMPPSKAFLESLSRRAGKATDGVRSRLRELENTRELAWVRAANGLERHSPLVMLARLGERVGTLAASIATRRVKLVTDLRSSLQRQETSSNIIWRLRRERQIDRLAQLFGRWKGRAAGQSQASLEMRHKVTRADMNLDRAIKRGWLTRVSDLASVGQVFAAVNHKSVLGRGYALVLDRAGVVLPHAEKARLAGSLTLRFGDGNVAAKVSPGRRVRRGEPVKAADEQTSLF